MFLAQPSLGFCGWPVTILSWGGEAPEAWGVQGQDSQAQNIHSHFRVTLI